MDRVTPQDTQNQIDEGADYAPSAGAVELSAVLGFVTEFNENVQIFNQAAMLVLIAVAGLDGAYGTLQLHSNQIQVLRDVSARLSRRIEEVARQSLGDAARRRGYGAGPDGPIEERN